MAKFNSMVFLLTEILTVVIATIIYLVL